MLIKLRNQEKDSKLRQEALRVLKETEVSHFCLPLYLLLLKSHEIV